MEKLDLTTPNFTDENIAKLAELFPNCVTESKGDDGEVKHAIDFDALRQEFSETIVEGPVERYSLNWPGKREALVTANMPISKTLRPCRDESVDFDTTKNIFIEGDNLDALKLLQESYLGKVKMIYIDPPYNTGKDFIYKDNYAANKVEFDEASGQKDEEGGRLVANPDSNGRYHSDWLSMMYSRIKLARNFLRDDGVLFVSIGDDEVANLRNICNEVFGEKNFCAQFVWNTEGNTDNQYEVKVNHEYVVAYYKNNHFSQKAISKVIDPNTPDGSNLRKGYADNNINKNNPENPPSIVELPVGFPCSEESLDYVAKAIDQDFLDIANEEKFISDELKARYGLEAKSGLPVKLDDLEARNYKLTKPCRIFVGMANKNKLLEFIKGGCESILDDGQPLRFYLNANAAVRYRKDVESPRNILSVLRNLGTTEKTKTYLKSLGVFYSYPKPVNLLKYLISVGSKSDDLIMDFFAGSASTAEACFRLQSEDGEPRSCILVQLPEELDPTKKEQKAAYEFCTKHNLATNVCEISKERIRRSGRLIKEEYPLESQNLDTGFRVFKIDSSNMQDVHLSPDETKPDMLAALEGNIKEGRTGEDLLFQVLLDWGVDLSLPIESQAIDGKTVFFVDGNALAACFDEGINEDFVKELAAKQPLRVVFRDDGFASDSVKINVEQIFKLKSPATDIRVI